MSEFIETAYNLVNAILYYKKKKDVSKLLQVMIRISDKSAEDFAELTLQGYFEKIIKKNKKKFLDDFKTNSKKNVKLIEKIKEDLTSYFITLNEILNTNKIPISDPEVKQVKLLDEMREILNMPGVEFYNDYILENIRKEELIGERKTKAKSDHTDYSSLSNEEMITLGYFLLFDKLYGTDSSNKNYYWGPFYEESYPPNCDEINSQHNNLIKALYPKNNTFKVLDVIETLLSKKLLFVNEGRWSKSNQTFWQSTITSNIDVVIDKTLQRFVDETSILISKIITKISSNDNVMMALLLLEEGVPEKSVEKLIGDDFKELINIGSKNYHRYEQTWRVKFNYRNNQFNKIEEALTLNKLEYINKINQKKKKIIRSLNQFEKYFIFVVSSSETIIGKYMGKNYSEQTIKKYEKKINEIKLNYDKKISVLTEFSRKDRGKYDIIFDSLVRRGIIWKERQGFSGYMDVHQEVLKSFVEIEPVLELKGC